MSVRATGAAEARLCVEDAEQFPDGPGYSRVLATSAWWVFSPPPQDWPLALCDFRSLSEDEGLPNQLCFVDKLPDDPMTEPVDESKMITSGAEFVYSPEHEWWYFPDMTHDEVLFFVFNDLRCLGRAGAQHRECVPARAGPP